MGAKASTASAEEPDTGRQRTFSTSSGSEVGQTGFGLLRALPGVVSTDRQRARSLSSVPDSNDTLRDSPQANFDLTESLETDSSSNEEHLDSPLAGQILGRVFPAQSLPSHIYSFNGKSP